MTNLQKKRHPCVTHVLFVPQEVTKAVSYPSSLRPLQTRQSVCMYVGVCDLVCVSFYWCRAVQGVFSTERIAEGAVWSAVISRREVEALKVTTVVPLMPVNVTEPGHKVYSKFVSLPEET